MHLFKPGSVGLGPYAFAPTGEGRWAPHRHRRAGHPRGRLRAGARPRRSSWPSLPHALEARPDPDGALAWARRSLRAGLRARDRARGPQRPPAGAARGARRPGPGRRLAADARLGADRRRERRPDRGPRADRERPGAGALADERRTQPCRAWRLASWVEEGVRRILRDAALGELGTDLNTAADETLIATGLRRATATIVEHDFRVGDTRYGRGGGDSGIDEHERAYTSPRCTSTTTRRPASSSRSRPRTRSASPPPPGSTRSRSPDSTLDFPAIEGDLAAPRADRHPPRPPPLPGARGRGLGGPRAQVRPLRRRRAG